MATMTSELTRGDDLTRALRTAVGPGATVAGPDHPDWERARLGWNLAVDQRPAAVVEVTSPSDVQAAVRAAAGLDHAVAAQFSGHASTRALDDTVVLRTTGLDHVQIDTAARVARIGAGVSWARLLGALDGTGLTGLPGSAPDISVAGFTLGSGLSWLGRRHGRGADALRAVELVDAEGRLREVTDATDPDLMRALRGGGGDFGVVTALELDLHPCAAMYGGKLTFPVAAARDVLGAYRELTEVAPPELTAWATLLHLPDLEELPPQVRGQSFVTIDVLHLGPDDEAEALLRDVRGAGPVVADTVRRVGPGDLAGLAEDPTEPLPAVEFTSTLRAFDESTIERFLAVAGDRSGSPILMAQVRHLGGAFALPGNRPAAAGPIDAPFLLFVVGLVFGPPVADRFGGLAAALEPELTGRTTFSMLSAADPLQRVFTAAELETLRATKRRVDPGGVIRSNHPVLQTR